MSLPVKLCSACKAIDPEFFSANYDIGSSSQSDRAKREESTWEFLKSASAAVDEVSLRYLDCGEQIRLHNTILQFLESAARGCSLCRIFAPPEGERVADLLSKVGRGDEAICLRRREENTEWCFAVCCGEDEINWISFSCFAAVWTPEPVRSLTENKDSHFSSTWMPAAIRSLANDNDSLMKLWVDLCVLSHPKCNAAQTPYTPTRLLDLKAFDRSNDLKLVISEGWRSTEYVALSHCWGPPEKHSLQTTKETFQQRLERIPMASLGLTFQDAVRHTRTLGYRYLWIDSLCIIQKDKDDFAKESQLMAAIYTNAVCTLAALSSKDGMQGCRVNAGRLAVERNGRMVRGEQIQVVDMPFGVRLQTAEFLEWGKEYGDPEEDTTPYYENPLRTRAWALQERLLSVRNISFSAQTMLWECRTAKGSSELPWTHIGPEKRTGIAYAWPLRLRTDETKQEAEARDKWFKIVEEYTTRKLTDPSDKFPALSGVASKFQAEHKLGNYYAGLWSAHLPASLLWNMLPNKNGSSAQQLTTWRAPSWSWASIEAPISYRSQQLWSAAGRSDEVPGDFEFQVIINEDNPESITPLATSDPFGTLASQRNSGSKGCMELEGLLRECRIKGPRVWSHAARNLRLLYEQTPSGIEILGAVYLDRPGDPGLEGIACLPIRREPKRSDEPMPYELEYEESTEEMYMGLALNRVPDSGSSQFVRVGLARWVKKSAFEGQTRQIIRVF